MCAVITTVGQGHNRLLRYNRLTDFFSIGGSALKVTAVEDGGCASGLIRRIVHSIFKLKRKNLKKCFMIYIEES